MAGDILPYRDMMLKQNLVPVLVAMMRDGKMSIKVLQVLTWLISNIMRSEQKPVDFAAVQPLLFFMPQLAKLNNP